MTATVADIERLKALADRLLPLAARSRGEVIAADDWNTVVGALLEVARAIVNADTEAAVPPHEHSDQVTLGWLDPRLRTLIERGPLADPAAGSRVTALERQTTLIGQRLDRVADDVRDVRSVSSRQETNDLQRESSLTALSRRVEGLTDPRDEISTLRGSLDAIGSGVAAVTTFASGLGDVTPAALLEGLTAVDQLKQRLTTPTGALLDAAEFERRLTELQTTLVTEEELTEAIRRRPSQLSDAVRGQLLEESKLVAQRQAEERATSLTEQLRGQLQSRIDEVADSAVQAAREATGQFRDELQAALTDQLVTRIQQSETATRERLAADLDAAQTALRARFDQRITDLEGRLSDRVRTAVDGARPGLLAAVTETVDTRLAQLDGRFTALQNGITELRTSVDGTRTQLASQRQDTATALANQASALRAEMTANLRTAVDQVSAATTSGLESVRAELAAERGRVNDQFAEVRKRVRTDPVVVRPVDPVVVRPVTPIRPLDPNQPPG